MKKSTDELMKQLKSKRNIDEYFSENREEMFFGSLYDMISFFMAKKNIEKKQVVSGSGLSREYCYEILSGKTKKRISRDKVIMLCFGLQLEICEAQQMLQKSGYAPLYARDTRDALIIYSIVNKISVIKTNIKLSEYNLEPLF